MENKHLENGTYEDELARQASLFLYKTRQAIEKLETSDVIASVIQASNLICNCRGRIITSGMGKAGHAALKVASTFSSFAISACYLHPAEASHGDIGVVIPNDLLLVFSNSGKTREVIETVRLFRTVATGTIEDDSPKVISITSHPDSPIRSMSDVVIDIGITKEAGHLEIAPTTSVTIMLIVSDMLATMCAWRRGITISDYAIRHHNGYIGSIARGDGIIN